MKFVVKVVDIYQAASRLGKYPTLFTSTLFSPRKFDFELDTQGI